MTTRNSRAASFLVRRIRADGTDAGRQPDELLVEEPLLIRVNDTDLGSTMRTPGNDFELAVGFCHAEGVLTDNEIANVRYCGTGSALDTDFNTVSITTRRPTPQLSPRLGTITSSCGLCGHDSIALLAARLQPLGPYEPWSPASLLGASGQVASHQTLFLRTGTPHVAAALDRDGTVVVAREDIGRHNALDKVIGRLVLDGRLPDPDLMLFVSSRASFELVQKAWAAGITAIVAVSGPSSLAVSTARTAGMTLVGFARQGEANQYSPA